MSATDIQWTDATWNPVRGCSRVSPGCDNCYAMRQAHRFSNPGGPYEGLTTLRKGKVDWAGSARLIPEMLDQPLRWRKPRRIFVNSMSDLFHSSLTNEEIAAVFGVMAAAPQHTFQVLTKRPERMVEWFKWVQESEGDPWTTCLRETVCWVPTDAGNGITEDGVYRHGVEGAELWPLPNVWPGVSVENQATADKRIPLLLSTPAAVRFISAEPLLGPIDLKGWGDNSPTDPVLEQKGAKWADYKWEDWVPADLRLAIEGFWAESWGRGPYAWLKDHGIQQVPRTGARITFAQDGSMSRWLRTDKMATDGVRGRYLHKWNNIGCVVADDGSVYHTAGGSGSGWLSKWLCKDGEYRAKLGWVIVGGESGNGARACDVAWIEEIVKQCTQSKVPVFVKQLGKLPVRNLQTTGEFRDGPNGVRQVKLTADRLALADKTGGNESEWPESLRVRQFPGGSK